MEYKIMVVDDSEDICEIVDVLLSSEGYEVITANNGEEALSLLNINQDTDLIILDIMMPGISGFEACKEIRNITTAPILFLSAKSHITDKEKGLSIGGDDYLSKPFSPIELVSRVKALLRRYSIYQGSDHNSKSETIQIRDLLIYPTSGEVQLSRESISLRYMEYQLLILLATHRGKIFSVQEIYETIWKEPFLPTFNNTVAAHIKNLRQKIENDPKEPKYIITVWGRGYKIV
ncbi:winged helix family two component transcriptional regulator [Tissierella praeacuta]|uniref:response regulator transcription factor n=1 Tax=Tissierella praeacuta TaxID=43131 RepID=UPI00104FEE2D|nr:response regulator transcription factor [Tissierella praeacuta]TCU66425.1 winged helix family two component transcriptional regulator [Tissierella praeacuta]